MPRILNSDQKQERVRTCQQSLAVVQGWSRAILDNIVNIDESAVSFHIPETKQQSKQWAAYEPTWPHKAKVQASRIRQMVLAFFNSKGIIHTSYMPGRTKVNTNYMIDALGKFMKIFRKKRSVLAKG